MAENTAIEWADHTFNPWLGCTKVSPACDHCYAEARMDTRLHVVQWGAGQPRKRTGDANWRLPLKWNREAEAFHALHGRRQRVFCASLADVFDNEVPEEWRSDLFDLIQRCENLDFLLLTKRVGNVTTMLLEVAALLRSEHGAQAGRERGLQAGPVGRAGYRSGGPNLASGEADSRPLDGRDESDAVRTGASGVWPAGRLSAGAGDDRRQAALRGGGAGGLAALQGADTGGPYGQPRGRSQAEQSADQSGAGDVQRTAAARGSSAGGTARRREGVEAPEGAGLGDGRGVDASPTSERLASKGHRGAVRDHAEVGLAHLHWQDLAARSDLLGWVERWLEGDAPPNVWIGATICNQAEADRDIIKLMDTRAAKRFLSVEPLLGPITLERWLEPMGLDTDLGLMNPGVDWVIVGGESGPKARPMHPDWVRSLRDQCVAAGVAFHFKQWGEWAFVPYTDSRRGWNPISGREHLFRDGPEDEHTLMERVGKKAAGRLLDGREWSEVPA